MKRQVIKRSAVGLGGAYLVLWLTTALLGVPQLRDEIGAQLRAKLLEFRPDVHEVHQAGASGESRRPTHPYYWVSVTSPGPLLLRATYASELAPLMGSGGTDWYLWLPGVRIRLATTDEWVS